MITLTILELNSFIFHSIAFLSGAFVIIHIAFNFLNKAMK